MAGKKPKQASGGDIEYQRCAAAWKQGRNHPDRGAANWMLDPADLPVDPAKLVAALRMLGTLTQDPAFDAARSAVITHELVDGAGRWKRYAILASPFARDLCEDIESMITPKMSERQAVAEAVVKWRIEAQSFDAAHKRLTRLLHAYRKVVGQKAR
jgi:hypothetical protein